MSFRSCLFAVRLEDPGAERMVRARAARLLSFYRGVPWGDPPRLELTAVGAARSLVGAIRFDATPASAPSLLTWGGPAPPALATARAFAAASDAELRALDGIVATIAVADGEVVIATGAGGVTALYAARSSDVSVWATHAATAGLLAFGEPAIEPDAIPELIALDYVGGDLTMVRGVHAVPTATRIRLRQDGEFSRSYWSAADRWARLPEAEAYGHGETHLLESLSRRLSDISRVSCGVTAGLDSRAAAVALRTLGLAFDAFTVGAEADRDVQVAREVASVLGAAHRRQDVGWLDEDGAFEFFELAARWGDGMRGMTLGAEDWPIDIEALVSGSGAEVGRGFYYPPAARAGARATSRTVRTFVTNRIRGRFGEGRPEVGNSLGASVESWLAEAESLGHTGWRSLDVLYGRQRWRRWYRAQIAPVHTVQVPAFSTPEVLRALASLPLSDRVSNGFNRSFLRRNEPQLAPGAPRRLSRREAVLMRARQSATQLARPGRTALGRRRAPARWPAAERWEKLPDVRRWFAQVVLAWAPLAEIMGDAWVHRTREGFLRDESVATEATLASAAPFLLQRALDEARADAPGTRS